MCEWIKCLFKGHEWYLSRSVRRRFNKIGIYAPSLMRHFCKRCGAGEDNSWAY